MTDRATLTRVAAAFSAKYPEPFKFKIDDFDGGGGEVLVFRIEASKVLGFRHLPDSSQTRWLFPKA